MNRYLFFFIIVLFIGCDKTEDNIFTQTPDERLKATADEYREALFSAPNGWFLAVDTKKDGAYRLWMSFEENERVGMLSDMDATFSKAGETSVVPCISSWRLKALLALDTHCQRSGDPCGIGAEPQERHGRQFRRVQPGHGCA